MKVVCPSCGFEDEGNFCSRCGSPLKHIELADKNKQSLFNAFWQDKCPVCKLGKLELSVKKKLFGLSNTLTYTCNHCTAVFDADGDKYKLDQVQDKTSQTWLDYGKKSLTEEEWKRISYGGISTAKQYEADMEQWLTSLKEGEISTKISGASSPVILKKNEELLIVLSDMALWESRKVTRTVGGYGGPSFRIAKGVSWRVGAFGAESRSHDELKKIDLGVLTLTNKRLVFTGSKRNTDVNLGKIVAIEPYSDGLSITASGRSKTQYYVGLTPKKATVTIEIDERIYKESFTGLMLQYMIEGLVKREEYK